MKPFVKFRSKQTRRRARLISPRFCILERLEDRVVLAAPTVSNALADQTGAFTTPFQFTVPSNSFTDADGDTMTLSATGVPAWLTFTPGAASSNPTGTFSGTPTATDVGSFNITVTATDSTSATNFDVFKLTIPANAVPSFTKGSNQTALEDATVQTVANWATNISQGLNESGQTVSFLASNDNPGLFSVEPAIAANGTLTYTPAANANGSATVTVFIHDNGGTSNGGVDTSASQTFTISLTAVNDVPSFTVGANQTVLEDAGGQSVSNFATAISAGANDSGQTVDFLVSNNNPSLFSTQPAISASGTLTYTPAANQNGTATVTVFIHDNGGTANLGVDTSVSQTFTITLTGVNDAPSFTKGSDQTVLEDAGAQSVTNWATNISAGTLDAGQTVDFQVANNNNSLFSVQPAISSTGTLTFTPAANQNGTATVTVLIHDNGGTANGGVEVSASQTFTITVTAVNDVPSFTKGLDQTVLEDSGAQSVANWATAISAGTNDSGQTVDFQLSNNNNALFSVQPAISSTGTLTYTPAANANGTATVTVLIHDNGGTAGGGVDTSATQTFTITLTAVNDAPSFTKGPDQTVLEDAVAQSIANWATNISAGTGDTGQTVDFLLVNNNNSLFSVQPAVSSTGTLTFTPAANQNGTATVTVLIHDNGGTANGGVEVSASQTFTITVTAVNDVPSFTVGGNQTVLEDGGAQSVASFATAISAGTGDSGQTVDFQLSNNHNEFFSVQPAISATGTLTYTPAANQNGVATVTVLIHDNGGTAGGGVDTSATQTFTITITAVNDVPSFSKGANQTVLEDAGAQSVPGWAININAGTNEAAQAVNFIVNSDNPGLFSTQPAVAANGTLSFTPAPNANGTTTITVFIHDDGGTTNGGVDTSASQTFTLTITAVNDVPSFTKGPDLNIAFNAAAQTFNGWATNISAGPADESSQTLNFIVTPDNPLLFSVPPAITNTGNLTFTPAVNMTGVATVMVKLHDNGGTTNGGVDTSAPPQTFKILLGTATLPDAPGGNAVYTAATNAKLRAFVVNGLLSVQINGIQYPTYAPASVTTLTINGGSKNDEIDLSGLDPAIYTALTTVKIKGNAGNDRIVGSFANDSVDAGAGNDTLTGGDGDDTLIGNAGTDLLVESATADLTLDDTSLTGLGTDKLVTIENASFTADDGGRAIDAGAFTRGAVTLIGGAGNDTLSGGSKNDAISGRDGDDILAGGAGNDTVLGGFGLDMLDGDGGNDLLIGGFDDDLIDGGAGRDTVAGGNGGSARGGDGVADAGDMIMNSEVISEAFKKLFAWE